MRTNKQKIEDKRKFEDRLLLFIIFLFLVIVIFFK